MIVAYTAFVVLGGVGFVYVWYRTVRPVGKMTVGTALITVGVGMHLGLFVWLLVMVAIHHR